MKRGEEERRARLPWRKEIPAQEQQFAIHVMKEEMCAGREEWMNGKDLK